jgi:hypothetical protein
MIKVRSEIIAATTGISKELRGLIIARSDLLTDATSTIVDAIDAGVYQDEAGLLEARKNLREKYLLPYWSLLPQMKTDAVLTWVSHLLLRARALTESGDLPSAVAAKITEAEVCLVDTEATLKTVAGEKDLQKMNTIISQARSAAISCIKLYRDAVTLENTELTPLEEVPIEPQWQKRSLRKLPKSRY